jgi:hypothetical protein
MSINWLLAPFDPAEIIFFFWPAHHMPGFGVGVGVGLTKLILPMLVI